MYELPPYGPKLTQHARLFGASSSVIDALVDIVIGIGLPTRDVSVQTIHVLSSELDDTFQWCVAIDRSVLFLDLVLLLLLVAVVHYWLELLIRELPPLHILALDVVTDPILLASMRSQLAAQVLFILSRSLLDVAELSLKMCL